MSKAQKSVSLHIIKIKSKIVYRWFECKVTYEKEVGEGKLVKQAESYLVDALNFTEAEKRIIKEMKPFINGEFEVSDIKRARFAEMFETQSESADKWYQCKIAITTIDEKKGVEKHVAQVILVKASDLRDAVKRLDEGMKSSISDYGITSVTETKIIDVYHYEEAEPEGFVKLENKDA